MALGAVMFLLAVAALMAVAALQSAFLSQRVSQNLQMQSTAHMNALATLRFCENELHKPDESQRVATLRHTAIPRVRMSSDTDLAAWQQSVSWTGAAGSGGASASRTTLASALAFVAGGYAIGPGECVAEVQERGGAAGFSVLVVTARGFAPDAHTEAPRDTAAMPGASTVWLQSFLPEFPWACAGRCGRSQRRLFFQLPMP